MSFITNLFSGGIGTVLDGASKIIADVVPDPNQKQQLTEKLQELITNSNNQMATLAEQQYEAQLKDIGDARAREIQIATSKDSPVINKITLPILAITVTIGFFGLLAYMLKYDVPTANKSLLDIMLGSLGTAWISIVGYYFGSSKGSDDKNKIIDNLSK